MISRANRRAYQGLTMLDTYQSGLFLGSPTVVARPNLGWTHVGTGLPLVVGGAAGMGVARLMGAGWMGTVGSGLAGMAIMAPFALFGGLAGAIGDWGTPTAQAQPLRAAPPVAPPSAAAAWTRVVQMGLTAGQSKAKPNISGAVVGLISTGVQAAGGIAGSAISAGQNRAGLSAQGQLNAQAAELAAAQALAAQAGATSLSAESTSRTLIIAGASIAGLLILGGLGLVAYRMRE